MKLNNEKAAIFILIFIKLLIHFWAILFEGYGVFRDELYYLSCSENLAFGYVDHPPFSIWILKLYTSIFGDHWAVIRIVPALLGAASVYMIIKTVRLMNGTILACWIAGIAFIAAPINIGFGSIYSMNSFELFFWICAFYQLVVTLKDPRKSQPWIILGVIIGLGMMNKISMAWFAIGMISYLVISPDRLLLKTKFPYIAGAISLILFLPFVLWNLNYDWAHIEFAANASRFKYAGITRMDFLSGQLLLENPSALLLLLFSMLYLFSTKYSWAEKSPIIIFFITMLVLLVKGHVKSEYMATAYAAIFITGAIHLANQIKKLWHRRLVYFYSGNYLLSAIILAPLACPILPVDQFINYQELLGLKATNNESKEESELPQFYADMHGWEGMAKTIANANARLTKDEKQHAVILANNYGEAGALRYYQTKYNLPPVLSRHNNHYLWGTSQIDTHNFDVFIFIDDDADHLRDIFEVVEADVVTLQCENCMPYENNLPVHIAKKVKGNVNVLELFFEEKNFN